MPVPNLLKQPEFTDLERVSSGVSLGSLDLAQFEELLEKNCNEQLVDIHHGEASQDHTRNDRQEESAYRLGVRSIQQPTG